MRVTPSLEEVLAHTGPETHMAISVEAMADLETPISLYDKLARTRPFSFLLESAEGGETMGRYSFIGFDPELTFAFRDGRGVITENGRSTSVEFTDPLEVPRSLLSRYRVASRPGLPRFQGGAVGYLGFDCVRYFEPVPIPGSGSDSDSDSDSGSDDELPEGYLMFSSRLVIFDHLRHRVILVDHVPLAGDRAAAYRGAVARLTALVQEMRSSSVERALLFPEVSREVPEVGGRNMSPEAYAAAVETAKEAIQSGEIFQVVLSQRFSVFESIPSFSIYRALRALNPSPYMFHLRLENSAIVGASPEVLVRLDGGEVLVRPIAGTRRRGETASEDQALEEDLLADEKELAEHRMLVDLGRNDVGRVAKVGTISLERLLHIERYSHVMHIVSDVRGKVEPTKDAFDVLRACFPAGTVSGAPKVRAMEIIAELEPTARGVYAGAVGYFDFTGNMDTCIAIRTLVIRPGRIDLQVGAGIVADSNPQAEYEECQRKARACLAAIEVAKAMEAGAS
ncbi:MAG: anthranilate synthase component I [Deltaproteobacteria bacterium]|nr:anthranilate synthase component I [Deltaproteobacteria bacterium]